jgi:hypothetical protein
MSDIKPTDDKNNAQGSMKDSLVMWAVSAFAAIGFCAAALQALAGCR